MIPYLGQPYTHYEEKFHVSKNEVRRYNLNRTVVVYARDNWLNDMSKPNQAALALTNWELPYDWTGNILNLNYGGKVAKNTQSQTSMTTESLMLSMVQEGGEVESVQDFHDVTMSDFRTAIDYLNRYEMSTKRGT